MLSHLLIAPLLGLFAPPLPLPIGDSATEVIAAAGDDVDALWRAAAEFADAGDEASARAIAERILRLDKKHEGAHKTLRHHSYGDQWFETYTALSKEMRAEAKRMWEKHGVVRFRDDWLPPADVPFVRMGWTQGEDDVWRSAAEVAELALAEERAADGWEQQDLVWIAPDDFDPWREGLYKCGEQWLTPEGADEYHSKVGQGWELAGEHFIVHSTLDRESTRWAIWYADQVHADLQRLLGLTPAAPPRFVALNGIPQYNAFAAGDPAQGWPATEASGSSSVHYAYFADAWYDSSTPQPVFRGQGVCYWQRDDPSLEAYGQHAIRHAAAQSYLEAVDPSWDTVSKVVTGELQGVPLGTFWDEKLLPAWLRNGAASYCERYFEDQNAQEGANPWWAREWALQNVATQGGLRELDEIFAFQLNTADPAGAAGLIHEAGLLVSFILDGDCKPVRKAHTALVDALTSTDKDRREQVEEALEDLEKALDKNRGKLDDYAKG